MIALSPYKFKFCVVSKYLTANTIFMITHTAQRKYLSFWGSIETILDGLEEFFTLYEVPLVVVDGQKVGELAACDKGDVNRDDLLSCVSNLEQVLPILKSKAKAGQVFQIGSRGHLKKSVVKIQSWMRMIIAVNEFIEKRRQKRASTCIQQTWRRVLSKCRVRIMLNEKRERDDILWRDLKVGGVDGDG